MRLEFHNHVIDRIAVLNGVLSGIALYPQVWRVLATGDMSGVSIATFSIISLNSAVWVLYAMHRGLIALGIASVLNFFASFMMVSILFWF